MIRVLDRVIKSFFTSSNRIMDLEATLFAKDHTIYRLERDSEKLEDKVKEFSDMIDKLVEQNKLKNGQIELLQAVANLPKSLQKGDIVLRPESEKRIPKRGEEFIIEVGPNPGKIHVQDGQLGTPRVVLNRIELSSELLEAKNNFPAVQKGDIIFRPTGEYRKPVKGEFIIAERTIRGVVPGDVYKVDTDQEPYKEDRRILMRIDV